MGASLLMVVTFVLAGLWLRHGGMQGYVITSAIDPSALPDPLAKPSYAVQMAGGATTAPIQCFGYFQRWALWQRCWHSC
jgi:hypothetical protein